MLYLNKPLKFISCCHLVVIAIGLIYGCSSENDSNNSSVGDTKSTSPPVVKVPSNPVPTAIQPPAPKPSPAPPPTPPSIPPPPSLPKNLPKVPIPLPIDFYEWKADQYNYKNKYSNRCVFPTTNKQVKGKLLDELFAWRDLINKHYIYRDEIVDVDPRPFTRTLTDQDSHLSYMTDKNSYIQQLRSFIPNETGKQKHDIYKITKTINRNLTEYERVLPYPDKPSYGIYWEILSESVPRNYVVRYTSAESPASELLNGKVKVKRGDKLLQVNGVKFETSQNEAEIAEAFKNLYPSELNKEAKLVFLDSDTRLEKKVTLRSKILKGWRNFKGPQVQHNSIIQTASGNVGYLHMGKFALKPNQTNPIVKNWKKEKVKDVILDLRYFDEIEFEPESSRFLTSLAFMLFGEKNTNKKIYRWKSTVVENVSKEETTREFGRSSEIIFNSFCPTFLNRETMEWVCQNWGIKWSFNLFSPFSNHPWNIRTFNSLDLDRVYILTTSNSCNQAEVFINALRGIDIEVALIGEATCGFPFGKMSIENCGITVELIGERFENNKRFSSYEHGFKPANSKSKYGVSVPGCYVKDDFTKALGDTQEKMLKAALQYRENKTCPPVQ